MTETTANPSSRPSAPPGTQNSGSQRHLSALDGLRATAVLSVVLYHTGQLPFGWLGVPMFFALSGHFITRTLLGHEDLSRSRRARDFFRNRALRLAPLYLSVCAVVTVCALAGYHRAEITSDLPYLWTWTYDFRTLAGDFAPPTVPIYNQFWSLCVEAQLYLVWALLVLLLPRRWFVRAAVALALGGPLLRVGLYFLLQATESNGYFRLFTIAQSPLTYIETFAVGALTALPELRRLLPRLAATATAVFVLATLALLGHNLVTGHGMPGNWGYPVTFPDHYGWVWQYTVVSFFFGALVHFASRGGPFAQILSPRWLVRTGVISYGIYALHVPVLGQLAPHMKHTLTGWSGSDLCFAILVLASTYVAAELSFRFLETPFLKLKKRSLAHRIATEHHPSATTIVR